MVNVYLNFLCIVLSTDNNIIDGIADLQKKVRTGYRRGSHICNFLPGVTGSRVEVANGSRRMIKSQSNVREQKKFAFIKEKITRFSFYKHQ